MSTKKPAQPGTRADKKSKETVGRLSVHTPTADEVAAALQAKEPTPAQKKKILSLKPDKDVEKIEPIKLSQEWYEFSVFLRVFQVSRGTANMWLLNGWLAYSLIGKIRIINRTDIEEMLMHFRRPSIWCSFLLVAFANSEWLFV